MPKAHPQEIEVAFASNTELRKRVYAAIDQNPTQSTLFRDISTYILNQTSQSVPEPASKKRKLEDSNGTQNGSGAAASLASTAVKAWRSYPGTSFSIPQRKKFTLELVDNKKDGGIRAIGADGNVEFYIPWRDVDQVFCLPVPEKAKRQHNFVVLPVHGDGVNPLPEHLTSAPEPIVWTFEEATGKNIVEGEDPGPGPMAEAIHHCLIQAGTKKTVIFPDADEFQSAIPQSHRKGEKAFHVKAHRGSKEGYLFFTSVGILYGFKKPLAFFDFAAINSISYTAVLRNTFNMVITTQNQEIEFGMLDQDDYSGINEYVQKHGLQDASMAATRRAKKLNINPSAEGENARNGAASAEDGGLSELQKAEQELQDMEDEDEEDYDPENEEESDGSGTDSEDDDEDGEGYDEGETYEEDDEEEGEDEEMGEQEQQ